MKDGGAKAKQDEGQAARERIKPLKSHTGGLNPQSDLNIYVSIVPPPTVANIHYVES